ncbi:hypothetical protein KCV06_g221, partial [Aureobasidium melanogenum]
MTPWSKSSSIVLRYSGNYLKVSDVFSLPQSKSSKPRLSAHVFTISSLYSIYIILLLRYAIQGIHEVSLQALLSNRSSRPTSLNINLTSRPPLTSLSHQIPLINDPPIGSTGNRKSTVFRSRTPSPGLSSSKTAMVPPEANPRIHIAGAADPDGETNRYKNYNSAKDRRRSCTVPRFLLCVVSIVAFRWRIMTEVRNQHIELGSQPKSQVTQSRPTHR